MALATIVFSKAIEAQITIFRGGQEIILEAITSIETMMEAITSIETMLEALSLVNFVDELVMEPKPVEPCLIFSKAIALMTLHVSIVAKIIILQTGASLSLASLVSNNDIRTLLLLKLLQWLLQLSMHLNIG